MIKLNSENNYTTHPLLRLGFRPFFFASGVIAVVSMLLWILFYQGVLTTNIVTPQHWHAHEMVYAYASAVVVGFLLTASRNWTGVQTIYDKPLLGLLLIWVAGRFLPFISNEYIAYQAFVDSSFLLLSTTFIAYPIIKAKNWNNIAIVSKLLLLFVAHVAYYLGVTDSLENGVYIGIYSGLYLIISLLFMMSRRLLPFFIERGLGMTTELKNSRFLDLSSLVLFIVFIVVEIFFPSTNNYYAVLPLTLFCIHIKRMFNWYNKGIWEKSLLWSIYLAYGFLTLGFFINALSYFISFVAYLDIHSFAFGIALMTLSMMCRVSLGHTGRNVFDPPPQLNSIFIALTLSFIFRVIFPLFNTNYYELWVLISQVLWIISFAYFVFIYSPIFFKARVDGQFG